jgi:hypothetical protein
LGTEDCVNIKEQPSTMAYNTELAERVRQHLALVPDIEIEEKRMFE